MVNLTESEVELLYDLVDHAIAGGMGEDNGKLREEAEELREKLTAKK